MIMKLSKGLAQAIVDEMMKVIPYNVNVMNEKGVIIGSGDKSRIGSIHEGALEAISSKKLIEIDKPGKNTLPGVNLPIIISDKVIGVVGITGSPQNVKPLSQLVGITASLLINQKKNIEKFKEKEKRLEEFLYELAYRKKQYDDQFIAMAKEYKIDLNKKLYSVIYIVEDNKKFENYLRKMLPSNIKYLRIESNRYLVIFEKNFDSERIMKYFESNENVKMIGIGRCELNFSTSFDQSIKALEYGEKSFKDSKIVYYEDIKFLMELRYRNSGETAKFISEIRSHGEKLELEDTLKAFYEYDGDISKVSKNLRIHRNTLAYRLGKVKEITGKDPRKLYDLFELVYALYSMDK